MSDPSGSSDRVGYRGDRTRERAELDVGDLPLKGRVRVTPVQLPRGWQFEVLVDWTGPPLPGSGFAGAGQQSDAMYVEELDRARRIARAAADELRRALVPDLRALARRV